MGSRQSRNTNHAESNFSDVKCVSYIHRLTEIHKKNEELGERNAEYYTKLAMNSAEYSMAIKSKKKPTSYVNKLLATRSGKDEYSQRDKNLVSVDVIKPILKSSNGIVDENNKKNTIDKHVEIAEECNEIDDYSYSVTNNSQYFNDDDQCIDSNQYVEEQYTEDQYVEVQSTEDQYVEVQSTEDQYVEEESTEDQLVDNQIFDQQNNNEDFSEYEWQENYSEISEKYSTKSAQMPKKLPSIERITICQSVNEEKLIAPLAPDIQELYDSESLSVNYASINSKNPTNISVVESTTSLSSKKSLSYINKLKEEEFLKMEALGLGFLKDGCWIPTDVISKTIWKKVEASMPVGHCKAKWSRRSKTFPHYQQEVITS